MNDTHIIVIGGGFAGVAAAKVLRDRGARVTMLEARATLGGRARSDVLDGIPIDAGAQLITSSFTRTVRMLAAPLHRVEVGDAVLRAGVRLPLRFGSVRSLLAFGGLTAIEKLRVAAYLLPLLARYRDALDADGARLPPALDHESARGFVERHVGAHAADTLVEPPCNGFYALRASDVSLAFFMTLGRYGSDGDVLAPPHGWSAALESALDGVEVVHGLRAVALELASTDAERRVTVHTGDAGTWRGDAAIIATGPRAAAALLEPHRRADDPLITWLSNVPMRSTFTLALALDAAPPHDAVGIYRDVREARVVSACAVHGAKYGGAARPRDVVLAWPTPAGLDALHDTTSDHIATAMLPEIETLVPAVRGHVTHARVYRFDEGSPIASPSFAHDRAQARRLAGALEIPVALAGDYLTTPLIEGAVASGQHAAERLVGWLSRR